MELESLEVRRALRGSLRGWLVVAAGLVALVVVASVVPRGDLSAFRDRLLIVLEVWESSFVESCFDARAMARRAGARRSSRPV